MILVCPACGTENHLPDLPPYKDLYRCRWCAEPFLDIPGVPGGPYSQTMSSDSPSVPNAREGASQDEIMASYVRFAAERVVEGKGRTQIADEMATHGVPQEMAGAIVDRVIEYRAEAQRREGGKSIGCGLLMLVVGGIVSAATYAAAEGGGVYFVTTGLFIVGGLSLLRGLYQWAASFFSNR